MATRQQLAPFEQSGGVSETYPYHENIAPDVIRLWTPAPNAGDYKLELKAVQEDPNDSNSWYGQYAGFGRDWDPSVVNFFKNVKMDYIENWDAMLARNIPPNSFPANGWKIVEFGLARFSSESLISRARWEHPDGSRWLTAYTWTGCG